MNPFIGAFIKNPFSEYVLIFSWMTYLKSRRIAKILDKKLYFFSAIFLDFFFPKKSKVWMSRSRFR